MGDSQRNTLKPNITTTYDEKWQIQRNIADEQESLWVEQLTD